MSPTAAAPSASLDGNNTHVGPSTPPDLERYVTEDAPLYKSKAAAIPKQPGDQQGYITVQPLKVRIRTHLLLPASLRSELFPSLPSIPSEIGDAGLVCPGSRNGKR